MPANIFADTGVNTTIIIGYKPSPKKLLELNSSGYSIFVKSIKNVGYEVRTINRVKKFVDIFELDDDFNLKRDIDKKPILKEDFTSTLDEFGKWKMQQESIVRDDFGE